ncbi:unnamed protein product [Danaus chrysippus]|uniref:(African queen) hypothetical protein n=1 Tax=Danaus chrysippus TaxID=151541 RepID=A0A8J2Q5Y3_9NEOP|nr:unnamed protein product [Danaus chrysippus]
MDEVARRSYTTGVMMEDGVDTCGYHQAATENDRGTSCSSVPIQGLHDKPIPDATLGNIGRWSRVVEHRYINRH